MNNPTKKPAKSKIWQWITTIAILLALISGSFLSFIAGEKINKSPPKTKKKTKI